MNKIIWLCLASVAFAQAHAQNVRHLQFQSKYDQFELTLSGNSGTIGGKPADLTAFNELLPIVTNPLTNDCPAGLTGSPDVTVREGAKSRSVYAARGIITDGTNCLTVSGDGLLYFPLHRDFLIGAKMGGIALKSPLKVFRQGVKVLGLKTVGKTWESDGSSKTLINWDFVDRFTNSLSSYSVRRRVNADLIKEKPRMIVQSGEQTYEFYKLTKVAWAIKRPGMKWLEASDDWSFWYDFDDGLLEDRYTTQIHFLEDSKHDKPSRLATIEKLQDSWSRNLRDLYHKMVLDDNEDDDVRAAAFKRLRIHPTIETAGVMTQFLAKSTDESQKKTASQMLKTIYPKGPLYNPKASANERAKTVEFWSHWWTKNQPTP